MPLVFCLVLAGEYLASLGLPRVLHFSTELSALVIAVYIVVVAVRNGLTAPRPAYWILVLLIGLHLFSGIVANHVQSGTLINSARYYFAVVPFFLLPLVARPNGANLRNQLLLIVMIGLIQLPIAAYQRMTTMATGNMSGDLTQGTLMNSGLLSVFLICLACVVFTAYLRKRISLAAAVPILLVLLVPTMINETKGSMFLIPFAFFVPVLAQPGANLARNVFVAAIACSLFFALYIPIYNSFIESRNSGGVTDFLTSEERLIGYLKKDAEVGTSGPVGRFDKIMVPLRELGADPVKFTLGLGMGTVTQSSLGPQYEGEHVSVYGDLVGGTVSRLLWEIGWLGLTLVTILLLLIFQDAQRLRRDDGAVGTLAQAWLGVVAVMLVSMFYKNVMSSGPISALFWYFSGVVVAYDAARRQTRHDVRLSQREEFPTSIQGPGASGAASI